MTGPFGSVAPQIAQLSPFPTGGSDGKKPLIGGWQRRRSPKTVESFARRFPGANIGIPTGEPSDVTVIDVDNADAIDGAIARFGESPVMVETPKGGAHIYFRHNGEGSRTRVDGAPIDIRGKGGQVIYPPSFRPDTGEPYKLIRGRPEDLADLPPIRPGALPETTVQQSGAGQRNDTLFRWALRQARACDDFDALLDCLASENDSLSNPLPSAEIVQIARSAWGYEERGQNLVGRGAWARVDREGLRAFDGCPDALYLWSRLEIEHGWRHGGEFILANALAVPLGWTLPRLRKAVAHLSKVGRLEQTHRGGRGPKDPPRYRLK